ncbi:hypothetical protein [Pectinatus haikarae]|uniref:Membrane protein YphA (DoxX/SURF4 family) n=1 Tax=Pectinatus haikarae TaxID=349096 RepID=A0ABT9Y738_9FIRM|nr:hypothetical protein [Pectinatus haikarae]MDQ0203642.1 putative membrane protein YphA (DoxX/SURF4 family) [Pectinatus haikarae]
MFTYFTVFGELAADIALLCGILTPLALLLGMLLNYNYLLAGTVKYESFTDSSGNTASVGRYSKL